MKLQNTLTPTLLGALIIPLLAGCASTPTALSPVGPDPASQVGAGPENSKGYLEVFTATVKSMPVASDDPTSFNLHSSYDIYSPSGKDIFVANHASDMDEGPDRVILPAGNYNVLANSTWCGQVSVPVMVQKGRTTVLHLDDNWWPVTCSASNQLVYLPNGDAVGWSGSAAKLVE